MSVEEIKKAVVEMPERDRAELVAWLLEILPTPVFGDEDDEGIQEALRRREELDSGRATPLSAAEFWTEVDRVRSQWR